MTIVNVLAHARMLEWKMFQIMKGTQHSIHSMTIPTIPVMTKLFEYYAAEQLTLSVNRPFHVWGDIHPTQKKNARFHIRDVGVDVADDTFTVLSQCKYYEKDVTIRYDDKLHIFFNTPIMVGRRDMKLVMIRTNHSVLEDRLQKMMVEADITDLQFSNEKFIKDLKLIKHSFENVKK